MKKLTTNRKLILIVSALLASILAGTCFLLNQPKKTYNYDDYYIPKEPSSNKEENSKDELPEMVLSLELLQSKNPDVIGIIEFDDRMIYEPIVQAKDNEYYVRKNIDRQYASAGIPFVGAEGNIFSTNVVIYGHSSTQDNIIFTPLMNYVDQSFYKEHPTFKFITRDEERTYEIFSVLHFDTTDIKDSSEFTQFEWRKKSDYAYFLNYLKANSLYNTGVSASIEDKLMTLVTCDTRDGNDRVVVIGKLVKHE